MELNVLSGGHIRASTSAALLAMLASAVQGQTQDKMLGTNLQQALIDNAVALSPITVAWSRQSTTGHSKQEVASVLHSPADILFFRANHRLIWQAGKMHETSTRLHEGASLTDESALDGHNYLMASHYPQGMYVVKESISQVMAKNPHGSPINTDYFRVAGFRLPVSWTEPRAASEVIYLLGAGGRLESVQTIPSAQGDLIRVTIVGDNPIKRIADATDLQKEAKELEYSTETPQRKRELLDIIKARRDLPAHRTFVFFLDPRLHFAVRRWQQLYAPATLLQECECAEFERVASRDLWLPRKCDVKYYELENVPSKRFDEHFLSDEFRVSEVETEPVTEDRFTLKFDKPGTFVTDYTDQAASKAAHGAISYTVPARPDDLNRAIENARKAVTSTGRIRSTTRWVVIVNLVIAAAMFAFILLRRIIKRRRVTR